MQAGSLVQSVSWAGGADNDGTHPDLPAAWRLLASGSWRIGGSAIGDLADGWIVIRSSDQGQGSNPEARQTTRSCPGGRQCPEHLLVCRFFSRRKNFGRSGR